MDDERYSLTDLTDQAGVSARTVRYYVAEGLLPPPALAGSRSYYTAAHRDRLQLIGLLKDAYLPLKEIRRRLAGLTDDEVHAALVEAGATEPIVMESAPPMSLGRQIQKSWVEDADDDVPFAASPVWDLQPPVAIPMAPPATGGASSPAAAPGGTAAPLAAPPRPKGPRMQPFRDSDSAADYLSRVLGAIPPRPPVLPPPPPALPPPPPPPTVSGAWRRIRLGSEAELLIADDLYLRKRDRVEWLVRWAQRVLETDS